MVLNTIMLLGVLTGILLAIGWFFFSFWGLVGALILALVINFLTYWFSDKIVLKLYRAKPLENPKINRMVEKIANEAKIPKPRLYVVDSKMPNAFATGRSPSRSAVAVTTGLMDLDDGEMEGVLAHELGHIRNRDTLVSTMAATIAGAISFLAHIGYSNLMFGDSRERGAGNLIGVVFIIIFAPLAALFVRLAISRGREFKADYFGALVTKKPMHLASALKKISSKTEQSPMAGNTATSHLWIVNPFKPDRFSGLFSTHPPLEERIKRLEKMHITA